MSQESEVVLLNLRVGSHSVFARDFSSSLELALDMGLNAVQLFMGNPKTIVRAKISDEDIRSTRKMLERFPTDVFTHFPYTSNLAGSVKTLAWNGDSQQDAKTSSILKNLEGEISVLAKLKTSGNITGVVIHPGFFSDRKKGLQAISKSISKIAFPKDGKLILENSAGAGSSLATTLEEIQEIILGVEEKKRDNIGVCIDTCHIFAYGEYDISCIEEVERLLQDFDRVIGLKKLLLIHLNDSMTVLGSRKDRHERIGRGKIWGEDCSSLLYLLKRCKDLDIPCVLENEITDIAVLAKICLRDT